MIELTVEQHQDLAAISVEPPRAHDPVTNTEYVLIRREVYERIKSLISEDKEWTQNAYLTAMEVFARDGWNDARMDVYDSLDPRTNQ
jgi:hypothetical protein